MRKLRNLEKIGEIWSGCVQAGRIDIKTTLEMHNLKTLLTETLLRFVFWGENITFVFLHNHINIIF